MLHSRFKYVTQLRRVFPLTDDDNQDIPFEWIEKVDGVEEIIDAAVKVIFNIYSSKFNKYKIKHFHVKIKYIFHIVTIFSFKFLIFLENAASLGCLKTSFFLFLGLPKLEGVELELEVKNSFYPAQMFHSIFIVMQF